VPDRSLAVIVLPALSNGPFILIAAKALIDFNKNEIDDEPKVERAKGFEPSTFTLAT
jgi:hypothetical protein